MKNKLVFPTIPLEVPFLGEGQINKHISIEREKQMMEEQNVNE